MLLRTVLVCTALLGITIALPLSESNGDGINYELLGGGFEGDMILPEGFDPTKESDGRGVAIYGPRQWPNNVVPYDLSLITNAAHRAAAQDAMNILTDVTSSTDPATGLRRTCVSFRPKTASDSIFLKVQYGSGCSASVGYASGERRMTLQDPGCWGLGTIQHELLHVLGFYHEQSRPDRDSHITVNYANVQTGKEHNFNKYVWGTSVLNQNTNYDYGSIMHYGANSFSNNGQPTITTKVPATIGQRSKLSAIDIAEVRAFYKCT